MGGGGADSEGLVGFGSSAAWLAWPVSTSMIHVKPVLKNDARILTARNGVRDFWLIRRS